MPKRFRIVDDVDVAAVDVRLRRSRIDPSIRDVVDQVVHPVQAPEKRRLPAAGRPDEGRHRVATCTDIVMSKSACFSP